MQYQSRIVKWPIEDHQGIRHFAFVNDRSQCMHRKDLVVVVGTLGSHHEEGRRSLRVSNQLNFRHVCLLNDMVDHCRDIGDTEFVKGELPVLSLMDLPVDVFARQSAVAEVRQPYVVATVTEVVGFFFVKETIIFELD